MICTFTMNAKEFNPLHLYVPYQCEMLWSGGSRQLSQENLLFAFPYVLALGDIIYWQKNPGNSLQTNGGHFGQPEHNYNLR